MLNYTSYKVKGLRKGKEHNLRKYVSRLLPVISYPLFGKGFCLSVCYVRAYNIFISYMDQHTRMQARRAHGLACMHAGSKFDVSKASGTFM
jgi:hypothetical protein